LSGVLTESFGEVEWIPIYKKCNEKFGDSDLSSEDAVSVMSEVSGMNEAICESVLRNLDVSMSGTFSQERLFLAMKNLSQN